MTIYKTTVAEVEGEEKEYFFTNKEKAQQFCNKVICDLKSRFKTLETHICDYTDYLLFVEIENIMDMWKDGTMTNNISIISLTEHFAQ